jgi:hypothetical protein
VALCERFKRFGANIESPEEKAWMGLADAIDRGFQGGCFQVASVKENSAEAMGAQLRKPHPLARRGHVGNGAPEPFQIRRSNADSSVVTQNEFLDSAPAVAGHLGKLLPCGREDVP